MRRTYYTINAKLAARSSAKLDPPHVAFANLGYDPNQPHHYASEDDIQRFVKRYGPLRTRRGSVSNSIEVSPAEFQSCQGELRHAWNVGDARYFTEPNNDPGFDAITFLSLDSLRVDWRATRDGLELQPVSLLAYMGILLARDLGSGIARKCGNPKCPAPYFIANRSDAQFCSHPCAAAISIKNFRLRHQTKKPKRRKR